MTWSRRQFLTGVGVLAAVSGTGRARGGENVEYQWGALRHGA